MLYDLDAKESSEGCSAFFLSAHKFGLLIQPLEALL
jgi:hypothetical protein